MKKTARKHKLSRKKTLRVNKALRKCFKEFGLNPFEVMQSEPDNADIENSKLQHLLIWVHAYRKCPQRAQLERLGYLYPPVEPDMDPDCDWFLFERWIRGEPLHWNMRKELADRKPADQLNDKELRRNLEEITAFLAERGVSVDCVERVPDRFVYSYLLQTLKEDEFPFMAPGMTMRLSGCDGYCPGCFQRPWCECGKELTWPEDEKPRRMVSPEKKTSL